MLVVARLRGPPVYFVLDKLRVSKGDTPFHTDLVAPSVSKCPGQMCARAFSSLAPRSSRNAGSHVAPVVPRILGTAGLRTLALLNLVGDWPGAAAQGIFSMVAVICLGDAVLS